MLTKEMEKALNGQITIEAESSQVYLAMASWAETQGMEGVAEFMYMHSDEERMHMLKLVKYVNERGGKVVLKQIDAPPSKWKNTLDVIQNVLDHECKVTGLINKLVDLALKEKDHASNIFLQWFVSEQVEEEESVNGVLEQLKLMGEAKGGLFMIDRELTKRSAGGESGEESGVCSVAFGRFTLAYALLIFRQRSACRCLASGC